MGKLTQPVPRIIVNEEDIECMTIELPGETPEFVVEARDYSRVLKCVRIPTRGELNVESLDSLARIMKEHPILVVTIITKHNHVFLIKGLAYAKGSLLFSINDVGYTRTNDGRHCHPGDYATVYGPPGAVPPEDLPYIDEMMAFVKVLRELYRARKLGD